MTKENRLGKVIEVLCAHCQRNTKHTINGTCETFFSDEERDVSAGGTHDLLMCNGCGQVTYRAETWFSEEDGTSIVLYPPRGNQTRERSPKDFNLNFGSSLESVYRQTIAAFNSDLTTLAGAGVRLLIEGICKEQGVIEGPIFDKNTGAPILSKKTGAPVINDNLEGKINGMAEKHLISAIQAKHLHEIRFLGNDAAHELDQPSGKVVSLAIDIVEHILDQIYEQPGKAKALQARTRPTK